MKKWIAAVSLIGVVFLGTYFGSPYLAAWNLKRAVASGNVDAINAAVDFPAVRARVKAQLSAAATRRLTSDEPAQRSPYAAIGTLLVPALMDRVVDAYVTPAGIAALVQGKALARSGSGTPRLEDPTIGTTTAWLSLDRFRVQRIDKTTHAVRTSLIFERRGFAGWKLVDLEIPDRGIGSLH